QPCALPISPLLVKSSAGGQREKFLSLPAGRALDEQGRCRRLPRRIISVVLGLSNKVLARIWLNRDVVPRDAAVYGLLVECPVKEPGSWQDTAGVRIPLGNHPSRESYIH